MTMNCLTTIISLAKKTTVEDDRIEVVVRGLNVKVFQEFCDFNDIYCEMDRKGLFYYATLRLADVL